MSNKFSRRKMLAGAGAIGAAGLALTATQLLPWDGHIFNPCESAAYVSEFPDYSVVEEALAFLANTTAIDCHTHLIGVGHNNSGILLNHQQYGWRHPWQWLQYRFYLNAGCIKAETDIDSQYVEHLKALIAHFPTKYKAFLLAFDGVVDENGVEQAALSAFMTPNNYAEKLAKAHPDKFGWVASIHPYRQDAVQRLEKAASAGAQAVKWLPPAMGIDPASPQCDAFYHAMQRLNLPLLSHVGEEKAVTGAHKPEYGHPLRFRRPLDLGVKVIMAHCASLGVSPDTEKNSQRVISNFSLFKRLMEDYHSQGNLYGDISAITQLNRAPDVIVELLENQHWHPKLINGSDYPIPAVFPLISVKRPLRQRLITTAQAQLLQNIRPKNPLLFDLLYKRFLRSNGMRFSEQIFSANALFS